MKASFSCCLCLLVVLVHNRVSAYSFSSSSSYGYGNRLESKSNTRRIGHNTRNLLRIQSLPSAEQSLEAIATASASATEQSLEATTRVFEAQLPEGTAFALGITSVILAISGYIWWNVLVPQKRTELLQSKKNGEVKEYLQELMSAEETNEKGFERWLLTDWLRSAKKQRNIKKAALPFLKKAKWNSGDNPILVAFGSIMALVMTSVLFERGSELINP